MFGKNVWSVLLTRLSIAVLVCTACSGLTDNIGIPGTPSITGTTPGNGQLTVNRAAVSGASSYGVYYSTSETLTGTTDKKPQADSLYAHTHHRGISGYPPENRIAAHLRPL
ncbi:MAG: hypothetical protein LBE10_04315 [Treponema sp.]|nr:hypothetical protein [Treponema sp.]